MKGKKGIIFYVVAAMIIVFALNYFLFPMLIGSNQKPVSYDIFLNELNSKNIKEVEIDQDTIYYTVKENSDENKAED